MAPRHGRRGASGLMMKALRYRDHEARVTGTELIAPRFLRVRLTSSTLFDEVPAGPASWVRLWFPDPSGSGAEFQRGYTLSEADAATGAFALDFVLHEPAGPASAWATSAQPGDVIAACRAGVPPFELPDRPPAGYLLLGDSASIPAINGILETLPHDAAVEVYLEEHAPEDREIPRAEHPRARVHWVPRTGEESLAQALDERDWRGWIAWAAPESGSLRHLRTRLRDGFGFPKHALHLRAYWFEGRPFGKRRAPADE